MKKFNIKNRKASRTQMEDTISARAYNAIFGGTILYGLLVNALLVFISRPLVEAIDPLIMLIGYLVCAFAGAIIANKSKNPVVSFVGYNLIVIPIGLILAIILPSYDSGKIILAAVLTGIVTLIMMLLAVTFPNFFSKLGLTLFLGVAICLIVEILATFLFDYRGDIFNWLFVGLFSLYVGYDWHKAQTYSKTMDNAIDSAIDLYLDIINIFLRILDLLDN